MIRILKWTIFLLVIGVIVAPDTRGSTKLLTLAVGLALFVPLLLRAFVRWIKSGPKTPAWDEIQPVPPLIPEPPLKGHRAIGRAIIDCVAKWNLNRKDK
jgi:hypothetical protein